MGQCQISFGGRRRRERRRRRGESSPSSSRNSRSSVGNDGGDHDESSSSYTPIIPTPRNEPPVISDAPTNPSSSSTGNSPPSSEGECEDARIEMRIFTFDELNEITKSFEEEHILGRGIFGTVFKGTLQNEIGHRKVAVKKMYSSTGDGLETDDHLNTEFLAETRMLSRVRHRTIIEMIGYCSQGDEHRLIVYEYMRFGSLESCLRGRNKTTYNLDWMTRMKIARGVAKALTVLHRHRPPIIHGDLTSSNILLGEGFEPKISDFGLAVWGQEDEYRHGSVDAYKMLRRSVDDDAYALSRRKQLSFGSDVYSFGVVLLELITGRDDGIRTADPRLNGEFPKDDFEGVMELAFMCLNNDPKQRPTMRTVYFATKSFAKPKNYH